MASLWELVAHVGNTGRLANHLLDAAFTLSACDEFTGPQIKAALEDNLGREFTQAEQDDIMAILNQLYGQPDVTSKVVYALKIKAAGIAAECGSINESRWRGILGIS
jgi:hypothetical protein